MPKLNCPIHGAAIGTLACHHVSDLLRKQQNDERQLTFVDFDGFVFRGWICDVCTRGLEELGWSAFQAKHQDQITELDDEDYAPFLDHIDLRPVCVRCMESFYPEKERKTSHPHANN